MKTEMVAEPDSVGPGVVVFVIVLEGYMNRLQLALPRLRILFVVFDQVLSVLP